MINQVHYSNLKTGREQCRCPRGRVGFQDENGSVGKTKFTGLHA